MNGSLINIGVYSNLKTSISENVKVRSAPIQRLEYLLISIGDDRRLEEILR